MNAAECGLRRTLVRRLCLAAVIAALSGVLPRCVQAKEPRPPKPDPYVEITVTPETLDLGSVPQPGIYDSDATLTVSMSSNVKTDGVVISATPLVRAEGSEIPLERFYVKKLKKGGAFVPLTEPVMVIGPKKPGEREHTVRLKFRVVTDLDNPAGEYTGTLVVTVSVPP